MKEIVYIFLTQGILCMIAILVTTIIYIFDGKAPELKSETQAKRREVRDEAEKIYNDFMKGFPGVEK